MARNYWDVYSPAFNSTALPYGVPYQSTGKHPNYPTLSTTALTTLREKCTMSLLSMIADGLLCENYCEEEIPASRTFPFNCSVGPKHDDRWELDCNLE